jgi:hypothetical protein
MKKVLLAGAAAAALVSYIVYGVHQDAVRDAPFYAQAAAEQAHADQLMAEEAKAKGAATPAPAPQPHTLTEVETRYSPSVEEAAKAKADKSPKATPAGTPVETDASIYSEHDDLTISLKAVDFLVSIVRSNGYKCDSVSAWRPWITSRGSTLTCNGFRYSYELADKGGNWVVTVD